jgi:hypothetical protein
VVNILGDEIVRGAMALQTAEDYVTLPGYKEIIPRSTFDRIRKYNHENDFWNDVLGSRIENRLQPGDKVLLKGFAVSQWIPRVPGLFWKEESRILRDKASHEVEYYNQGITIYNPVGKSMHILGGIGNLRLLPNSSGRLICASSSGQYWRGIPILLNECDWHYYADLYSGSTVDIYGTWALLPHEHSILLGGDKGIPRGCIMVTDIKNLKRSIPGSCAAWTLFEYRDSNMLLNYAFAYCTFQIDHLPQRNTINQCRNNEEINNASSFIKDYLKRYRGLALTDFDETEPRIDAYLPVNELMSREVDSRRLRSFVERVKDNVLSPETVKYQALRGILMNRFSLEDLRILAMDYVRVDLETLVAPIAGKASQVDALIQYCEEADAYKNLIAGCIQWMPELKIELAT